MAIGSFFCDCFERSKKKHAGSNATTCAGKGTEGEFQAAFAEGLWGALYVLKFSRQQPDSTNGRAEVAIRSLFASVSHVLTANKGSQMQLPARAQIRKVKFKRRLRKGCGEHFVLNCSREQPESTYGTAGVAISYATSINNCTTTSGGCLEGDSFIHGFGGRTLSPWAWNDCP